MTTNELIKKLKKINKKDLSEEDHKTIAETISALNEIKTLENIIKEIADETYEKQLWRDYKANL